MLCSKCNKHFVGKGWFCWSGNKRSIPHYKLTDVTDNKVGKMTDAEIKKALECCIKSSHFGECFENECPLVSKEGCKVGKETLYPYALDLINRQEGENKKNENIIRIADKTIATLQAENSNLQEKNSNLTSHLTSLQNNLTSAKAEVERLKETIDSFTEIGKLYSEIKAEAYKEFEEKVQSEILSKFSNSILERKKAYHFCLNVLDNTLNELVGDALDG